MTDLLKPVKLSLRCIEDETAAKTASLLSGPGASREQFLALAQDTFDRDEMANVLAALAYAESLPSRDPNHPSMQVYFAHPLRVASFVMRLTNSPSLQTTTMALLHNVFEVSGLDPNALNAAGFDERIAEGIQLLTINRAQQYDPAYLEAFHEKIEGFGEDLMLVRCVDRLDNLLAFDLIDRTPTISTYVDLSERFVVPLATMLARDFGEYLQSVVTHVKNSECNQELKLRYHELLKQTENVHAEK